MPKISREEYETLKNLDRKWKWIARDESGELYTHEEKPKKTAVEWTGERDYYPYLGNETFHFIQWKDEEPYSIAELIEEYEVEELRRSYFGPKFPKINGFYNANLATWVGLKESEETEVKDIEWLKEEIRKELESWYGVEGGIDGDGINEIMLLIDQLGEPEVLSQGWIDGHKHYYPVTAFNNSAKEIVDVEDLQNLLVPKQEEREQLETAYKDILNRGEFWFDGKQYKVVPKQEELEAKIQELIEAYKQEEDAYSNPENGWISGFIGDLESLLEEEQKYYVIDRHKVYLLAKEEERNKVETVAKLVEFYGHEDVELNYQLTEQEIKDYDERYWPFAVKVEELGE